MKKRLTIWNKEKGKYESAKPPVGVYHKEDFIQQLGEYEDDSYIEVRRLFKEMSEYLEYLSMLGDSVISIKTVRSYLCGLEKKYAEINQKNRKQDQNQEEEIV